MMKSKVRKALTVAGSDPGGGAGIQADLKTFSAFHIYGMSVITALTAQNTTGVCGVLDVEAGFVTRQLDAVLTDLPPDAVKTGMLSNASIIEAVASRLREYRVANVVVDPVMTSKSGVSLLQAEAVAVLRSSLLPLSLIVTPNTEEARTLAGVPVDSIAHMEEAARIIHGMGPKFVLIKGGHLAGDAVDVLFDGDRFSRFVQKRIPARDSHGTGCVLSAAITAQLALGKPVEEAVRVAKDFVTEAIRHGLRIGKGQGPCDPLGLLGRGPV
jgi:hydroxymethylpyrimidine/phosphomethylpyrimidine kinase